MKAVRTLAVTAFGLAALAAAPALAVDAEDRTVDTEALGGVLARIDANAELAGHHRACPDDIYRSKALTLTDPREEIGLEAECGADPAGCLNACLYERDADRCFTLGYLLHVAKNAPDPRYAEMLYAQACASGSAVGCTNRGAGIRNGDYEGDPFGKADPKETDACLTRTFTHMCAEDDAWGCFMVGQSYEYGEGVAADEAESKRFYRMACDISPDSGACTPWRFEDGGNEPAN